MSFGPRIIEMLEGGASYSEIEAVLGCSRGVVSYHAKKSGLRKASNASRGSQYDWPRVREFHETHTSAETRSEFGISKGAWSEALRRGDVIGRRGTGDMDSPRPREPRACSECPRMFTYKGTLCYSCRVNRRRFGLKERMIALKGGRCQICGYDKSKYALQFHHRDPTTKEFSLSGSHCRKWEDIEREVEKCDLLCANCHAEVESVRWARRLTG